MKYRSEIDGLRAVAVLPVILFHAGFETFSGGFVGVDVFFVISGYLITSIILSDMEKGEFSLLTFYERRARRILPALFFMMLICIPVAWYLLLPNDMEDFSANLGTAAIFLSNFYLLSQTGYFGPEADLQPLVHTWSLSIEEQFYLFFPTVLIFTLRKSRRFAASMVLFLLSISLLAAEWGWRLDPERSYFHSLTRFWELMIGALAAFYLNRNTASAHPLTNNILALVGLVAILYSVFAFDERTPFPSLYALVPTLGTVLIILFANTQTLTNRFLSLRIFIGIGLISYSLYLWHQPVFAFWRYYHVFEATHTQMSVLALLCFPLAFFSYRIIEQPFRLRTSFLSRSRVFAFSTVGILLLFVFGLLGHLNAGFPNRLPDFLAEITDTAQQRSDRLCSLTTGDEIPTHPVYECMGGSQPEVLFLGDSHSQAIYESAVATLHAAEISSYATSYDGCIPLPGFYIVDVGADHQCHAFVENALSYAQSTGIETIVLTARYPLYLYGDRFNNMEGGVEHGDPVFIEQMGIDGSDWDDEGRRRRVLQLFEANIIDLAEVFNVVLVNPIPEAGWDVPQYGGRLARNAGEIVEISTSAEVYRERAREVIDLFQRLAEENETIIVAPIENALCDEERCFNIIDNEVLYYDDDHLSSAGAARVAPFILNTVQNIIGQ